MATTVLPARSEAFSRLNSKTRKKFMDCSAARSQSTQSGLATYLNHSEARVSGKRSFLVPPAFRRRSEERGSQAAEMCANTVSLECPIPCGYSCGLNAALLAHC